MNQNGKLHPLGIEIDHCQLFTFQTIYYLYNPLRHMVTYLCVHIIYVFATQLKA